MGHLVLIELARGDHLVDDDAVALVLRGRLLVLRGEDVLIQGEVHVGGHWRSKRRALWLSKAHVQKLVLHCVLI